MGMEFLILDLLFRSVSTLFPGFLHILFQSVVLGVDQRVRAMPQPLLVRAVGSDSDTLGPATLPIGIGVPAGLSQGKVEIPELFTGRKKRAVSFFQNATGDRHVRERLRHRCNPGSRQARLLPASPRRRGPLS